jgi:hypothetical protein
MAINLNATPVYFFHIPKTSGRYFVANSCLVIENELIANDTQYGDILKSFGHRAFTPLDTQQIMSVTFLRDPVARSVSHWLHLYFNTLTDDIAADRRRFIDFLHANPTKGIIDYQTKFIAYNGANEVIPIDETDFIETLTADDISRASSRLAKVSYVFDMKNQSQELSRKFLVKLYDHFQLTPTISIDQLNPLNPIIDNPDSKKLYDSLVASDKQEIADLMPNDMNLYNSAPYTSL